MTQLCTTSMCVILLRIFFYVFIFLVYMIVLTFCVEDGKFVSSAAMEDWHIFDMVDQCLE